jgi:hypothetical protein
MCLVAQSLEGGCPSFECEPWALARPPLKANTPATAKNKRDIIVENTKCREEKQASVSSTLDGKQ